MFPENFHGFKILAHCGGGAYGDVYYCEDISGKKMALKVVSKLRLGSGWERELKGVRSFRKITDRAHSLLQIFHVGEDGEHFYYTMEPADNIGSDTYVPDTLAHRLGSGPLAPDKMLGIFSDIYTAIKTLHSEGFAHRDIKPDNILFVDGKPKLADIGLLSSLSGTFTMMAGTPGFLPPELTISELTETTDRESRLRNDLYAFGKVIYCAVSGLPPNKYPSIPQNIPLTKEVKLFRRLAFQLCDIKPEKRLNNIEAFDKEFSTIQKKILGAETLLDRLKSVPVKFRKSKFPVLIKTILVLALVSPALTSTLNLLWIIPVLFLLGLLWLRKKYQSTRNFFSGLWKVTQVLVLMVFMILIGFWIVVGLGSISAFLAIAAGIALLIIIPKIGKKLTRKVFDR